MKPAPFDYLPCDTEAEALACLAEHGDEARILAGGQSLVAMLNMRLLQPQILADIGRIASLAGVADKEDDIAAGAAVTQARLLAHPGLAGNVPLLAQALPFVGHYQTRNRGTVCGSLAHADPSSELPLVSVVLNAAIVLRSAGKERTVQSRDFFLGLLQTARRPDELLASVRFPKARPGEGFAFAEMAMRHGDFAIISVAVKTSPDAITIGIGGSAERPEVREWPFLEGSALEDALNALAWDLPLQDDVQAPASYRRRLVRLLGRQAIEEAQSCGA